MKSYLTNSVSTPLRETMRLLVLATVLGSTASFAADAPAEKPKPATYLTVETAGPDYPVQGEYLNDWGGAQVIALGDNNFRIVTFKGGLPGSGWDQTTRTETPGKRQGDKIVFVATNGYRAELAGDTITISSENNGGPWEMKKTSRTSPTLGAKPPAGAIVLYGGPNDASQWENAHVDDRQLLQSGTKTKKAFQNYTLHVEFLLPFKPLGRGQDRGNSGVYMQDRYEVQVLDSFGLKGENNECGGIYSKHRPLVNACFPPLVWQTYDIDFVAAQFDGDGKKTKNAVITVKHNGILVHDHREIDGPTGGGAPEKPTPGAIQLQGHGNPVFYRNIWIVEK